MPPGPMVLRLAWDEQYYTQNDFLLWYGRERGFEIWEEAGNVEDSDAQHVDHEILNEQRSREAAAKPLTCQVCGRTLPRTQFRAGKNGKFDLRKPQTCEECRAEGKLPTRGWKKRRLE